MNGNKGYIFYNLMKKDLLEKKTGALIAAGLNLIAFAVLFLCRTQIISLSGNSDDPAAFYAGIILILGLLWTLWSSVRSLSLEWELNTVSLVMSLPVTGVWILGARIISTLALFMGLLAEGAILTCFISFSSGAGLIPIYDEVPLYALNAALFYLYLLVAAAVIIVLCQLAYTINRLFGKHSNLLTFVSLVAVLWLFLRGSAIVSKLVNLLGLPDVRMFAIRDFNDYTNPSPLIAVLLITAGFFLVTARLHDRVLEA